MSENHVVRARIDGRIKDKELMQHLNAPD